MFCLPFFGSCNAQPGGRDLTGGYAFKGLLAVIMTPLFIYNYYRTTIVIVFVYDNFFESCTSNIVPEMNGKNVAYFASSFISLMVKCLFLPLFASFCEKSLFSLSRPNVYILCVAWASFCNVYVPVLTDIYSCRFKT